VQNSNDAGDIGEEVRDSLGVLWAEKMATFTVVLLCFSLFSHTFGVMTGAADKPDLNVPFCYCSCLI
jgi:hypothetical protein